MTEWIRLTEEELQALNPGHVEHGQGVEVHVFMSPHDVPDAVRGRYDNDRERFIVEFRYISEEPQEEEKIDAHVSASVGRHSGRLYAILIDVKALRADSVHLRVHVPDLARQIGDALKTFANRRGKRRQDNYRLAEELIERRGADILEPLASA